MASKRATRVTRKWEVFAGRNRFWCDGRVMTAPHPGFLLLTLALICGTSALHLAFDGPYLAAHVSAAVPAGSAALALLTLAALLRTALSDPGIIPRAAPGEAAALDPPDAQRPPPRALEVLVRGRPVKLKYCFTCKMFRPPRASHCSLCDNCVDRFDHHCPWVGNCVGRRNYRYFYTFVVSLSFLCVFVFACAVTHLALVARRKGLAAALRYSPASALVAAVCFLAVWSVLGLAGFHTYLASTDQTTNEDIKGSFSRRRSAGGGAGGAGGGGAGSNPYSRGHACANCWHVLCGPLAPSLIDRRGVVTEEGRDDLPPPLAALLAPAAPTAPVFCVLATPPTHQLQTPASLLSERGGSLADLAYSYTNRSLEPDPPPAPPAPPAAHAAYEPCAAGGAGGVCGARGEALRRTTMIDAALDLDDADFTPLPPHSALPAHLPPPRAHPAARSHAHLLLAP